MIHQSKKLNQIINQSKTNKLKLVINWLEFFLVLKEEFYFKIKNKEIFLDLKLNDIPNTCAAAINL